jgi:hypothetical protein
MTNPWLKKNPFLSMWMSGANRVVGTARAHATAAIKREASLASRSATSVGTKQMLDFWSAALGAPTPAKDKRRK